MSGFAADPPAKFAQANQNELFGMTKLVTHEMGQPSGNGVPALGRGAEAAFEMKFLLSDEHARAVEDWARGCLALDPHADPALGGYRTSSVYLDTAGLDVFYGSPGFKRRKFRIRRYGTEAVVFLERKARSGDRVRKRRACIPETELAFLEEAAATPMWPGHWFRTRLLVRGFRPVCLIGYDRVAFMASTSEGLVRLTLDRRVRGAPTGSLTPGVLTGGLPFLEGQTILELKFQAVLPSLFRRLIQDHGLTPAAVSKYRLCVRAWALDAPVRAATGA
jgi:hypothetical protein